MTNDYQANEDTTPSQFKELKPTLNIPENYLIDVPSDDTDNIHKDIKKEPIDNYELLLSTDFIPDINIKTELYDDTDEILFDRNEWIVLGSLTSKLRAPRQNEFLYLLLENPKYSSYASWIDKEEGLFKIHETERVATLWTKVKNRQTIGIMDYDIFARGIRSYYRSGLMVKTHKKHTFRFKLPLPLGCIL